MKRVLIACEGSQIVCNEFRKLGYEAYSCDLKDCSGRHPEWHIKGNVLKYLNENWDLMVAHPPCTYLSVASAGWINIRPERKDKMKKAALFFKKLLNADIEKIAIENPVIYLDAIKIIKQKYNQIIEPYQFGEPYKKRTCLWLKNLPELKPTKIVKPLTYWVNSSSNYRGFNKLSNKGLHRNPVDRSKSFKGIAKAMAKQWGDTL